GQGGGTRLSRPFGVSGVMTMKIMISTSRMSINGTTLGDESAPPFSPPTSIPIASLLWAWDRAAPQAVKPCRVGSGAALRNQQTNGTTESTIFNPRTADEEGTLHSGSSG